MVDVQFVVAMDEELPRTEVPWTRLGPDFTGMQLDRLQADVLGVLGDDHFVACVTRVYDGLISPLPGSGDCLVSKQVHGDGSIHEIARALSSGGFDETDLATLRITDTVQTSSMLGFSFGAGIIESAFEARERVGRDAGLEEVVKSLSGASSPLKLSSARLSVDWAPVEAGCGWIHASTLVRSWLGTRISDDGAPRFRIGDNVFEWLSHATRLGKLVGGGKPAANFDAIHIDADTGYVVDGRRIGGRPRVIQVRRGPRIRVAALR